MCEDFFVTLQSNFKSILFMTLKEFYDYAIQEGANDDSEIYVRGYFGNYNFSKQIDESKIEVNSEDIVISLRDVE